jgi:phenylpyruvate tautomerase
MPYLKVQTNKPTDDSVRGALMTELSAAVASGLGKPERYVMVAIDPALPMVFAGTDEPCAYLELKSIGLPQSQTAALSESLCDIIGTALGITPDRIYIEFADAPRAMWGWNRGTF